MYLYVLYDSIDSYLLIVIIIICIYLFIHFYALCSVYKYVCPYD